MLEKNIIIRKKHNLFQVLIPKVPGSTSPIPGIYRTINGPGSSISGFEPLNEWYYDKACDVWIKHVILYFKINT